VWPVCHDLCVAKTKSTCEMNDIRGSRVNKLDDRYSIFVAEFRGGGARDQVNLVNALKAQAGDGRNQTTYAFVS